MRWLLLTIALAVVGAWLAWGGRPDVVSGVRADIDPAPFRDPAKDAQPVAQVVKPASHASSGRKPNIVLILADDLGYGDLASYGTKAIRTPNLDRLAAEGVRFTQFYSSASVCSPSRAGLLTGRYPVRTGVSYIIFASDTTFEQRIALGLSRLGTRLGTGEFHDSFVSGIPDSEILLPEALKVAGYATGMVGKWHLGDFSHDRQFLPTRHGFDFFEGIPHSNDEFPVSYWRNDQELSADVGLDQEHMTADLTKAAVSFIDTHKDQPFFLYFAHKDVHLPFFPSQRFKGRSAAGLFGDAAEELDWSVGEVLRALDERGLREDTLVIFTSDNGPWYEGSTEGLRGRKGMQFEGSQRVPMLASWPGHLPAGARADAPAMNIDLFPTLLGVAGLDPPTDRIVDGRDLWGVMSGTSTADPHEALLFFNDKVIAGVRGGPWKYYRYVNRYYWPAPMDSPGSLVGERVAKYGYTDPKTGKSIKLISNFPLLYDLRIDTAESYNVADRHPAEGRRLLNYIESWEQDYFANPRGWKQPSAKPSR
jgi:arylsulfatase A-like enzyme